MADEMDESKGAEEKESTPEKKRSGDVEASSESGTKDAIPTSDLADDVHSAAEASAGVESEHSASVKAPVSESAKTLYDEPLSVDPPEPRRPQTTTPESEVPARVGGGELDRPGLDLLYDVELDATLQFGSKEMLLRDVLELGPGDVVELDRHIAQPVDLVVGDRIVARGEVVVASGNFALRVTEVATPQMRLESIRCLF